MTNYVTKMGYKQLYEDYLKVDKEITIANKMMGESVKRDNDLRENPEFMELRVKAMYELPAKKQSLWERYNSAIVIEETDEYKNFDGNTVIRGCEIKVQIDGEECKYQIKGSNEGDIFNDILSCDAPMAQALLGHKIHEVVKFNDMKIRVMSVKRL